MTKIEGLYCKSPIPQMLASRHILKQVRRPLDMSAYSSGRFNFDVKVVDAGVNDWLDYQS